MNLQKPVEIKILDIVKAYNISSSKSKEILEAMFPVLDRNLYVGDYNRVGCVQRDNNIIEVFYYDSNGEVKESFEVKKTECARIRNNVGFPIKSATVEFLELLIP